MPRATYTSLATKTLTSPTTTVTFSTIPATYRDLILVISGSFASAASYTFRFNGDTGSNYSMIYAQAVHGGAITGGTITSTSLVVWAANNLVANTQFTNITQIMDYSITDKHKTVLNRNGGQQSDSNFVNMSAGGWLNTSVITSIAVIGTANFNTGTTISLYGIVG